MIEFTLVGIPMIFVLISIVEMARGMWLYNTLAFAVKAGTRYAIVHGDNCATAPNSCQATVANIAAVVRDAGAGLLPGQLQLTLINSSGTVCLNAVPSCPSPTPTFSTLTTLLGNNTVWPTSPGSIPGNDIIIQAQYPFQSAISLFWPGAARGSGITFPTVMLPASSRDKIVF